MLVQIAVIHAGDRAHAFEDLSVLAKALKIALEQKFVVVDGGLHAKPDEPVLVGVRKIPKQDTIDNAENGRSTAGAERHGHHGNPELRRGS